VRTFLWAIVVILLCGGLLPEAPLQPPPPPQVEWELVSDITVCKYNPWTNTEVCSTFPD
jgi:hypothetical protein